MRGQSGHNTRLDTRLPPSFLGMDAWMTSQLNVALARKLRGSLMFLACIVEVLAIGVFTTRHLMTSGRLVQELNVCTVWRGLIVCTNTRLKQNDLRLATIDLHSTYM